MVRKTVYYSGQVQGVGFRMTANRIAGRYNVRGYVRNMPDGRVELIAEGDPRQVDAMLDDIARSLHDFIHDAQIDPGEPTGEFSAFGIRY